MMRVLLFALCAVAEAGGAAELQGRLFFTPAQRTQLEAARAQKDRQQPPTQGEVAAPPPAPEIVIYSGIVRRNDGKTTVWLNDRPISDRKAAAEAGIAGIRTDGAITLKPAQSDRSVSLKVGQQLDIVSGVIEEPYARRSGRSTPDAKPAASSAAPAPAGVLSEKTRKRSDEN